MILNLQEPFSSKWRKGYLKVGSDGRKYVSLWKSNEITSIISYARYLKSVQLGYEIPPGLEVDHENNDRTDDRIENLQLLTPEQNRLKEHLNYVENVQVSFGFDCAYCENPFIITEAERNKRLAQTKSDLAFCSHSCSTAFNLERLPKAIGKTIDLEMQERIKSLRTKGLSGYKISELTGLSRITVMKYW